MMDTLTLRHQASGIRHQASGIRHQASGKKSKHSLSIALAFLIVMISMMVTIPQAQASGIVTPTYTFLFQGCGGPSDKAETICSCMFSTAGASYVNKQFAYTSPTTATCYYQNLNTGWWYGGTIPGWHVPTCPSNSLLRAGFGDCACIDPTVSDATGTSCVPLSCGTGYQLDPTGTSCIQLVVCEPGYKLDPTGTSCITECQADFKFDATSATCVPDCQADFEPNAAGTSCVPKCPIPPLPEPPFDGDTNPACTAALEQGKGKDVNNACPPLHKLHEKMIGSVGQIQCLADKINKLALTPAYTGPSATIRTEAYQQHFVDIWKWSKDIKKSQDDGWTDAEKQACAPVVAKVAAELSNHGIDAQPSNNGTNAPHVLGIALDVSRGVKDALIAKVTNTTVVVPVNCFLGTCMSIPVHIGDVQDYVNSATINPPACNLRWGGRFTTYDPVHFQLP